MATAPTDISPDRERRTSALNVIGGARCKVGGRFNFGQYSSYHDAALHYRDHKRHTMTDVRSSGLEFHITGPQLQLQQQNGDLYYIRMGSNPSAQHMLLRPQIIHSISAEKEPENRLFQYLFYS